MKYENLTPEQREKAKGCKTPEELLKLAADEGYKLSDEEIASISGGGMWGDCDDYNHKRNPIQ